MLAGTSMVLEWMLVSEAGHRLLLLLGVPAGGALEADHGLCALLFVTGGVLMVLGRGRGRGGTGEKGLSSTSSCTKAPAATCTLLLAPAASGREPVLP